MAVPEFEMPLDRVYQWLHHKHHKIFHGEDLGALARRIFRYGTMNFESHLMVPFEIAKDCTNPYHDHLIAEGEKEGEVSLFESKHKKFCP